MASQDKWIKWSPFLSNDTPKKYLFSGREILSNVIDILLTRLFGLYGKTSDLGFLAHTSFTALARSVLGTSVRYSKVQTSGSVNDALPFKCTAFNCWKNMPRGRSANGTRGPQPRSRLFPLDEVSKNTTGNSIEM